MPGQHYRQHVACQYRRELGNVGGLQSRCRPQRRTVSDCPATYGGQGNTIGSEPGACGTCSRTTFRNPGHTLLENSVWGGTHKSSGTFNTLFESRLLRAKRYLDEPFEITLEIGLFGDGGRSWKVTASNPIDVPLVSSWDELQGVERGVPVLKGDSPDLVPDVAVDAVVADP